MKKTFTYFLSFFLVSYYIKAQNNDNLIFKNDNQIVRIEIESKQNYFELNKLTKFNVFLENFNLEETSIIGKGIKIVHSNNKSLIECSVLISEKSVENGIYKIFFMYFIENERKMHIFKIPVKQTL